MKIYFVTSSTWHDRYLLPIAEELKGKGYETIQVRDNLEKDYKDGIVISSYHQDLPMLTSAKKLIFIEHAVSLIKSSYIHPQVELADYVLVQGEVFNQWLKFCYPSMQGLKTGWHRIEKLYNQPSTRQQIIEKHNLDSNEPIIVYAPSWDSTGKDIRCGTLSESYMLFKQLKLPNFLIISHPSDHFANNIFKEEKDIIRNAEPYFYLKGCDLLISDTSSLAVEFLVMDKPIIQLDKSGNFDSLMMWGANNLKVKPFNDLFGFLQIGEISNINHKDIIKAIDDSLSNPNKFKKYREFWKNKIFYNLGNSLNATVNAIETILTDV